MLVAQANLYQSITTRDCCVSRGFRGSFRAASSGTMTRTIIIIRIGDALCALDQAAVREVVHLPELAVPPSLPAAIEGVLNIGGDAVLVVELGRLLGRTQAADADPLYRHVVVLAGGREGMGLLVDRVEDVRGLDNEVITPVADSSSLNACVQGQVDLDGLIVHLLDAERIFLAAEQARFAEVRAAEQARLDALEAT